MPQYRSVNGPRCYVAGQSSVTVTTGRVGLLATIGATCLVPVVIAWAEYADITLNTRAEAEGVAPVVYPHWFHRIRFQCSVCHVDLGIKMGAGTTGITMEKLIDGQYCGACHDGETAWSIDNCDLCHSGRPGLKTGIQGGHQTSGPGIY